MAINTLRGRDARTGQTIEVAFADGIIRGVQPCSMAESLWISTGLVDLQVNGYGGIDLNSPECTPQDVCNLVLRLAQLGTTTFLPTLITNSLEGTAASLRTIAQARAADPRVAHAIARVHLEGPHISPLDGYRGAHPLEHVRPPSLAEFHHLQQSCDGLIGLVTLSPHWDSTADFVRALTSQEIRVSLGHTHASSEQINSAVDAGARLSTHLGNGIAATLARHPNPIWAQLADDRLNACFITDGAHLPAEALRPMFRAKGLQRAILVSDSVALAGSAPGRYTAPIGGDVVVSADGAIRMADSNLLAGSGIALKDAVARAVMLAGISLADALHSATELPASFIATQGRVAPRAKLATGASADLFTFSWNPGEDTLRIHDVALHGNVLPLALEANK